MEKEQIEAYFALHQSDMMADICRLVRIRSDREEALPGKPFGEGPAKALGSALQMAEGFGLKTKNYENYVGTVDLGPQERKLAILAHLDVVPAGEGWRETKPFDPIEKEGKLYGRGTSDDKGPAVAALYALRAVKELGVPLKSGVRLILGTDEECGSSDIVYYYKKEPEDPMTFSPDASFPVVNVEKAHLVGKYLSSYQENSKLPRIVSVLAGIKENVVHDRAYAKVTGMTAAEMDPYLFQAQQKTKVCFMAIEEEEFVEIYLKGRAAHASTPEQGNNALTALLYLFSILPLPKSDLAEKLRALSKLFPHGDTTGTATGIAMSDEESGALTISLNMLKVDNGKIQATFDCRAPISATKETLGDILENEAKAFGFSLEQAFQPAHLVPEDTPFIQTLLKCYEQYTGKKGSCLSTGGGTYVHDLKNGVAFGCSMPETDNRMHGADEFAIVEELITGAKIFTQAIIDLCGA